MKPSKRDAPAGMFLASAFGLQVAAQLAYGAPAHGCPRHRASARRHVPDRSPLFRSNTIQYEGQGTNTSDQRNIHGFNDTTDTMTNITDPTSRQRKHQSVYESSCRR